MISLARIAEIAIGVALALLLLRLLDIVVG